MRKYQILGSAILIAFVVMTSGCSDYLDKTEKADLTSEDVFKNFISFNGYVEVMYSAINMPHNSGQTLAYIFNYGADVENTFTDYINNGNYMQAISNQGAFVTRATNVYRLGHMTDRNQWRTINYWAGWLAIRIANVSLANLHRLENATEEERNIIAGQCYFFRAHFHWEIMRAWGAIPYIEEVLNPDSDMKIPVLSFHETAEKVIADFDKAATLLPENWDATQVGNRTIGYNFNRPRPSTAIAFKSEVLLFCGSPLMNGVSTGSYTFNTNYMKRAADAAWEIIKFHRQGLYQLQPWATYSDMFWKAVAVNNVPGGPEVIFRCPIKGRDDQFQVKNFMFSRLGAASCYDSPTASFVDLFEMKNGYPITDPESGFNPMKPWENRDPRFYYNLVLDGDQTSWKTVNYAEFYIGGRDRGQPNSLTGFGVKKYTNLRVTNMTDGIPNSYYMMAPRLRLAEIYLIYAEAVNEAYGPMGKAPNADLTAIDAVNEIRARANMPPVNAKFTNDKEVFRGRIWNERDVELAFEGKRWYDIRRWYVAHLPEYKVLDALDFDKDKTYFTKRLLRNRVFEMKHYWMPFPPSQVSIYKEWKQNPGW